MFVSRSPFQILTVLLLMVLAPSFVTTSLAGAVALWKSWDWWWLSQFGFTFGIFGFGFVTLAVAAWKIAVLAEELSLVTEQPKVIQLASPQREEVRLVPLQASVSTRLVDGLPEEDLRWFVRYICVHGHSQRASLGQKAPSGRVVDAEYWAELSGPLRKFGIITGVKPRSAGVLAFNDPELILTRLGLN